MRVGGVSADGVYESPDGVNLVETSNFYIKSNMRTLNRDPVSLGYSNIIAKIPITRSYNGVEKYQQPGFSFAIRDRSVSYIIISVLDDDMRPVTFNGGSWSLTMEFAVVRADPYSQPADYRTLTSNNGGQVQRTLRTINGRSRLPFDKGEIISLQDRLSDLNSDILQNLEDITDIRGNYIPQTEKPDLLNPAWVAPLQNQVKISGFDLDISIQGPSGVSPDDPGYLPPIQLTSALENGYQYIANNLPDAGYEVYMLSGDGGVLFTNALFWPVTISLNVPKSVVTKYQIGAGFPS